MKIKNGFLLKNVADSYVVVPIGDTTINFNSIINLNGSGAFLWESLQNDITSDKLVELVLQKYDVDYHTALNDVESFILKLKGAELLE